MEYRFISEQLPGDGHGNDLRGLRRRATTLDGRHRFDEIGLAHWASLLLLRQDCGYLAVASAVATTRSAWKNAADAGPQAVLAESAVLDRFDQLQQSLAISRKVLAERLRWLTETGVLDRREYSSRPFA